MAKKIIYIIVEEERKAPPPAPKAPAYKYEKTVGAAFDALQALIDALR